ncbi:hypothetical protein ACO2RV_16965 [Ancylobacter sp. VNQ12]|uniref:hypothetical protein n=1 Tax=Ancylobacter sp. VNQ12 TaxID=3400920 RepID=UPI003C07CA2D
MHQSLQNIVDQARNMMQAQPETAAALIEARSDELDEMHVRAGNGHHRTLQYMARTGLTAFDLRLAIDELRAIARGDEVTAIQIAAE